MDALDLIAAAAATLPPVNLAAFNGANCDNCSLQMETVRFYRCLPNRVDVETGNSAETRRYVKGVGIKVAI